MTASPPPKTGFSRITDTIEETLIALILGLMTAITFANVIARYLLNENILWALEVTVFLFAWLVLLGMSYCVKHAAHLGVDVLIDAVGPGTRKVLALISVTLCLIFSGLLLYGAWDYWYAFATKRAFLETDDVPMPEFLQFFADWVNAGERYEKLPRFIPYFALPLGVGLMFLRYVQAAHRIIKGDWDRLIASHEAEEAVGDVRQGQEGA